MPSSPSETELARQVARLQKELAAAQAARSGQDRYRNFFESIQDVYFETGLDGTIMELSPSIEKISGYRREVLIGTSVIDLYHDPEQRKDIVAEYLETGRVSDREILLKDRDGRSVWCAISAVLMRDRQGQPEKMIGTLRNIDKRKRQDALSHAVREDLTRTSQQLSLLLDSLPIVPFSCRVDADFSLTYVGPGIEEITGYGPEQFVRHSGFWMERVHPDDRGRVGDTLATVGAERPLRVEYRFQAADGRFKWLSDIRRLIPSDGSGVRGMVGALQDITADKKLRQEAEYRLQQVVQADKLASLGEVVAGVAHEINNPNSFISYNVPLLDETWRIFEPMVEEYARTHPDWRQHGMGIATLRQDMREIIEAIRTGSERINRVVANLKDYARLDEGAGFKPVAVNDVVERTLTIVGAAARKAANQVDIQLGTGLPAVPGHFQKLEQVVANLVLNAANAVAVRQTGRIAITTRHIARLNAVLIEVSDNGCGMSPEVIQRIFEPFFTTRRESGGTGLGLSVSYGLIQEHNGVIGVLSRPGIGTRFTVYLPVDRDRRIDLKPTILCVDDEPGVLSVLNTYFVSVKGMALGTVNRPGDVMDYIEQHPEVDMVLSDIVMPGMDGWSLLRELRQRFPLLAVILYSGSREALEPPSQDSPAPDFLMTKPLVLKELYNSIHAIGRQRL